MLVDEGLPEGREIPGLTEVDHLLEPGVGDRRAFFCDDLAKDVVCDRVNRCHGPLRTASHRDRTVARWPRAPTNRARSVPPDEQYTLARGCSAVGGRGPFGPRPPTIAAGQCPSKVLRELALLDDALDETILARLLTLRLGPSPHPESHGDQDDHDEGAQGDLLEVGPPRAPAVLDRVRLAEDVVIEESRPKEGEAREDDAALGEDHRDPQAELAARHPEGPVHVGELPAQRDHRREHEDERQDLEHRDALSRLGL